MNICHNVQKLLHIRHTGVVMFRASSFILFIFLISTFLFTSAQAEKRVALVIGNSAYQHIGKLQNPANDADLMERTLKQLGFEVIVAKDVTQSGMKLAISQYARKVNSYGTDTIGLVFYAGHGVQVDGLNYLIPVDAKITSEAEVSIWAFPANDLLYAMGKLGNRVNIIVFDACRNNPYRRLFRSATSGLASMVAPQGSFIAFSAQPGAVAADGTGKNSPFTQSLAKHLLTRQLKIDDVLKRVGRDVYRSTRKKQRPWLQTDIYEELCLAGACGSTGKSNKELETMRKRLAALEERLKAQKKGTEAGKKSGKIALGVFPKKVNSEKFVHGYKFQDCPDCPKMIVVRGGAFTMGASKREKLSSKFERPQHKVTIKKFAVGQFEVTFNEWDACVSDGGCKGYKPSDNGWGRGTRPVINVSWEDAKSYVKWLSRKTGQTYRLLTEAEWEYAAGAARTSVFWWGNRINDTQANSSGVARKTLPVNSFKANPFGLYNVHGNVWELVEDCNHESYNNAPADGSAWLNANGGQCSHRIGRGGAWDLDPVLLRLRIRVAFERNFRNFTIGFRVARTLH